MQEAVDSIAYGFVVGPSPHPPHAHTCNDALRDDLHTICLQVLASGEMRGTRRHAASVRAVQRIAA